MAFSKEMPIPEAATQENADREPDIMKSSLGSKSGGHLLQNKSRHQKSTHDYYRAISSMDLGVGRIMEELAAKGLAANTVVLFTSDNGYFRGEHGMSGKWLMYEPSLRVPGFYYDPRTPTKATTDRLVTTIDFSAAILALAGLEIPSNFSGMNLTQLRKNPRSQWRKDFLYSHPYGHGGKIPRTLGVRSQNLSYTRYLDLAPPLEQLFDLKADPDQLKNLAADPAHADILNALRLRCDELYRETGPHQCSHRLHPSEQSFAANYYRQPFLSSRW